MISAEEKIFLKNLIKKKIWHILALILIIAASIWIGHAVSGSIRIQEIVQKYGYLGILFAAILSGFNISVSIPIIAFLPIFLASNLNLWIIIGIIAVGTTTADAFGYLIGRTSRSLVASQSNERISRTLQKLQNRYHWAPPLALFLFASVMPFPNEVLVIPLGFLGYRLSHLLLPLLLGNAVFTIWLSLAFVDLSSAF